MACVARPARTTPRALAASDREGRELDVRDRVLSIKPFTSACGTMLQF